jgi:hypothetical protein
MMHSESVTASRIREGLRRLRSQVSSGDQSELALWVLHGTLACSQRPLRDDKRFGGRGRHLPAEARPAMVRWVERIVEEYGIRSIICLMHPKELRYYEDLRLDPGGLLGFYERNGILVHHLPWADPAHAKSAEERSWLLRQVEGIKVEALKAFEEMPKPVLLHCSAGIDRTAPVAAYVVSRLEPASGHTDSLAGLMP